MESFQSGNTYYWWGEQPISSREEVPSGGGDPL